MRLFTIFTSITFMALSGCGGDHADHADSTHAAHAHDPSSDLQLSLNDGVKWKMDDHTRSTYIEMVSVAESELTGKALGVQLQNKLNKLISGCTMTGEAHNQLHIFLTEFMPVVKELSETGDSESSNRAKELLHSYPKYFE